MTQTEKNIEDLNAELHKLNIQKIKIENKIDELKHKKVIEDYTKSYENTYWKVDGFYIHIKKIIGNIPESGNVRFEGIKLFKIAHDQLQHKKYVISIYAYNDRLEQSFFKNPDKEKITQAEFDTFAQSLLNSIEHDEQQYNKIKNS